MTSAGDWVAGARPRTLPAAVAPVLVGTGAAAGAGAFDAGRALLALVVALSLQVAVNYANDYSDGVRGTDSDRVGPTRLVASRLATATAVRTAAVICFGIAAVAGLALAAMTSWWLLAVGAVAIAAAWFYTGGAKPYGYRALGEVSVFVFFGVVAVVGTAYVQAEQILPQAVVASVPVGLLACALLVVNNLRDIDSDAGSGKRTLAVVLGERRTRWLYAGVFVLSFVVVAGLALFSRPFAALGLAAAILALPPVGAVLGGARGADLLPALRATGLIQLLLGVLLAIGLAI
ncbi:MAG: 1,4-dihydroxy-2-naphthoate polyprenyltransferase [Geodermatophilaceae bacterium]|nr:1,4-dihydroxy-2-naphthoate polyprenyltransferase [Geodermatophilaceae bacterium]